MRLPIKLNQAGWPRFFSHFSFVFDDPRPLAQTDLGNLLPSELSKAISTLNFGVDFKSTYSGRHKRSDRLIAHLYRGSRPVILDVGASDGSTSLDLIRSLGDDFSRYFVTDLNLSAFCGETRRGVVYFMNLEHSCTLRASRKFLVYAETHRAVFPLVALAKALILGYRGVTNWHKILLLQPELIKLTQHDQRVSISRYDLFTKWNGQPPDLIKIANLLNPKYFSTDAIKRALEIQCGNLPIGGRLLLVADDRGVELFSLLRKTSAGMRPEYQHAGGAEAAAYLPAARVEALTWTRTFSRVSSWRDHLVQAADTAPAVAPLRK
jgi:hypothetical protein